MECLLFSVFVTKFNGLQNNEKEARDWRVELTFLELCDPPNHETAQNVIS